MKAKEIYQAIDFKKLNNKKLKEIFEQGKERSNNFEKSIPKMEASFKKIYDTIKERKPEALKNLEIKVKKPKKDDKKPKVTVTEKDDYIKNKVDKPKKEKKESFSKEAKELSEKENITFKQAQKKLSKQKKDEQDKKDDEVKSELQKLEDFVKSDKFKDELGGEKYPKTQGKQSTKSTSLQRDSKRQAKPCGYRMSKNGNMYREIRDNRCDRNAVSVDENNNIIYKGKVPPFLEKGGLIDGFVLENISNYPSSGDSTIKIEEKNINLENGGNVFSGSSIFLKMGGKVKVGSAKIGDKAHVKSRKLLGEVIKVSDGKLTVKFYDGTTENVNEKNVDVVREYLHGGKTLVKDMFKNYTKLPLNVKNIVVSYQEKLESGDFNISETKKMLQEVNALGYTFDYGLDGEPFALRKKGVPLVLVEGFEDGEEPLPFKKGGKLKKKKRSKASIIKDRKYFNPNESWEVDYAKKTNRKKVGYKSDKKEHGGLLAPLGNLNTLHELVGSTGAMPPNVLFEKGGDLDKGKISYIPNYDLVGIVLKDGKTIENVYTENRILNGIYVSSKSVKKNNPDEKQMSLFKKGGTIPKGARYYSTNEIDYALVYDMEGGATKVKGKFIMNGFWVVNEIQSKLIDKVVTRGEMKKSKKTTSVKKENSKDKKTSFTPITVEEAKTMRGGVIKLAKSIRKDGENWFDTIRRAGKLMS